MTNDVYGYLLQNNNNYSKLINKNTICTVYNKRGILTSPITKVK